MDIFYYVFLYFIIYSILGWICEVVYCYIPSKKFTNRGFLDGPYCPIYGFGALIVAYFLIPVRHNIGLVFILGMVLASVLEYITSYVMEKLFNTRWWDYSNHKLNINGRVCLLNSFLFGILSIITMYLIHPFVIDLITKIPVDIVPIISTVVLVLFTVDCIKTVMELINLKQRLLKLHQLKEELDMKLSEITSKDLVPMVAEILERQIKDLIAERRYYERRLILSFRGLKSSKFNEQFKDMRQSIEDSIKLKKSKHMDKIKG